MAQHIVTVFCEGPHDVAFLVKILKTAGYKTGNSSKIGDFPSPFDELLKQEAEKSNVEDLNIQELRNSLLPNEVLLKSNYFIFFYALGGDGKKSRRIKLLEQLHELMPEEEGERSSLPLGTTVTALYFFDADEKGVSERLKEVSKELAEVINGVPPDFLNTNGLLKPFFDGLLNIGAYIFSNDEEEKGDLEDILIPLMTEGNEKIFDDASKYLQNNFDDSRLFPNKLVNEEETLKEVRETRSKKKLKYDEPKSLLGVVGQLQKSGGSNTVCIGQTDYLTLDKIGKNKKCQSIIEFFNSATE